MEHLMWDNRTERERHLGTDASFLYAAWGFFRRKNGEESEQMIRMPKRPKRPNLGLLHSRGRWHHNLDSNDGAKKAQADHKLRRGAKKYFFDWKTYWWLSLLSSFLSTVVNMSKMTQCLKIYHKSLIFNIASEAECDTVTYPSKCDKPF